MSYILEALRKADAQRERDPARGIHAQPVAMGTAGEGARAPARPLLWGALAVGAGALAVAGWQLSRQDPEAVVTAAAPAAMAPPPVAAPTPAPRPVDPPAAPAAAVMPPAPPMPPPPPPAPAVEAPVVARAPAASAAILASAPPDAPKLAVTGGVYSANKAQRMLIVNGQVFNEGAEPVPGVILEQIRPNVAVMSYRGQRYMVNY